MATLSKEKLAAAIAEDKRLKDEALAEWKKNKETLKAAAEAEKKSREKAIEYWFPDRDQSSSFTISFEGQKEKLSAQFGKTYKFIDPRTTVKKDQNVNEAVDMMLDEIEKLENGKLLADRLVRWNPALDKSEYDKLPEKAVEIVNEYLEIKDSSPQLKFE